MKIKIFNLKRNLRCVILVAVVSLIVGGCASRVSSLQVRALGDPISNKITGVRLVPMEATLNGTTTEGGHTRQSSMAGFPAANTLSHALVVALRKRGIDAHVLSVDSINSAHDTQFEILLTAFKVAPPSVVLNFRVTVLRMPGRQPVAEIKMEIDAGMSGYSPEFCDDLLARILDKDNHISALK